MPTFRYRARDKEGMLVTGEIEAVSAEDLKEGLFREGMIPLHVKELKPSIFSFEDVSGFLSRVRHEDLIVFTRQFYTLFKAGVSMDTILATVAKQVTSRSLGNALIRIRADVAVGATLAQAFGRHPRIFNELYVSMLAAGEEAGVLEEVLKNLSELLERDYEIQRNVKSATLYPKIVVIVLFGAIVFLMTFVVPRFVDFYAHYDAMLPLPTRILMGLSSFFRNYWYVGMGSFVLAVFLYRRFYQTKVGRFKIDRLKFKLPVFGQLNLKVANARFCRILSVLYTSGLAMPRSLDVVANVIGNLAFALEVHKIKDELQRGATLSEAISKQTYFSPVIVETTAVGERAGALGEMLSTVAGHYDLETSHMVKNLTTLIEPLLLMSIFGIVALLALAIFLPVWNMSTVIGGQ